MKILTNKNIEKWKYWKMKMLKNIKNWILKKCEFQK